MINREDSALIARERQNRSPATHTAPAVNIGPTKTIASGTRAKPPMRAGKSTADR